MQQPSYFTTNSGRSLAYAATSGSTPGVMFLTGFKSDMTGQKALALEAHCARVGRAFLRFDYSGHGASGGMFEEGCIGDWLDDALAVFDALTQGPVVLVGSSMGGWIGLLLARARPQRVAGFVGLASAPDFTEALIWNTFDDGQRRQMMEQGHFDVPNCYGAEPYRITRRLVEEGRNHLLLHQSIPISCPVRLIHGTADEDVPWQMSQKVLERLESQDTRLTLVKGAGHRLSEPDHLRLMIGAVSELVTK